MTYGSNIYVKMTIIIIVVKTYVMPVTLLAKTFNKEFLGSNLKQ